MNEFLAGLLRQIGYEPQPAEKIDNRRYVVTAIKTQDGRTYLAGHLGRDADDAAAKLVNSLKRP